MIDLTTITTPIGLLDAETQAALKAHGGPYEFFSLGGVWDETPWPSWQTNVAYRVKRAPPQPREWWIIGGDALPTLEDAKEVREACELGNSPIIHVREVLP